MEIVLETQFELPMVVSFVTFSGSTDILQVELYVIHQVLTLAKGMGFYDSI